MQKISPLKVRPDEKALGFHLNRVQKIYVDHRVVDAPQVEFIQNRFKAPLEVVDGLQPIYREIDAHKDPVLGGKCILYLTRNRGAFVKACPGTPSYLCCGYKILHVGTFCTMDCSYCILQAYFRPPVLQFFVNHEDMFAELGYWFSKQEIFRIGTGEFTDSLIWEYWTDLSTRLVPKFADQHHMVLEMKSKTAAIKNFQHLHHGRKTIMSWSLNSETVIQAEERATASLIARLKAAKACESWGYPLAFHFDPLIIYDGWEPDYRQVVQKLFEHVSPRNVVWISLGALRFMPELKPIIQRRFPESKIIYGEFITGLDGKMRYLKRLRTRLYRKMVGWIREYAPQVLVYLCMEDDEVWQKALGFTPSEKGGLAHMLDQSAMKHCQLK